MNPLDVRPDNIDSYRQNLPVLVAQDLREHFDVPLEATAKILLARGVMKWLACRRDIIALKDQWRAKLRELQAIAAQSHEEYHYRRGYMAALKECREAVRAVCHSSRWRAPDTDRWSSWYVSELAKEAGDGVSPVLSGGTVSISEVGTRGNGHPDAREGVLDGVQVVAESLDTAQVEG